MSKAYTMTDFVKSGYLKANFTEQGGEEPEEDMTISLETSKTGKEDQNWTFKGCKRYFTIQDKATGAYLAQGEGDKVVLLPSTTAVDDSMLWRDVNLNVVGVATLNIVNKKTGDFWV